MSATVPPPPRASPFPRPAPPRRGGRPADRAPRDLARPGTWGTWGAVGSQESDLASRLNTKHRCEGTALHRMPDSLSLSLMPTPSPFFTVECAEQGDGGRGRPWRNLNGDEDEVSERRRGSARLGADIAVLAPAARGVAWRGDSDRKPCKLGTAGAPKTTRTNTAPAQTHFSRILRKQRSYTGRTTPNNTCRCSTTNNICVVCYSFF